jgi:hypothetical protein
MYLAIATPRVSLLSVPARRAHAVDLQPGDRLRHRGELDTVASRARALDGTIDFTLRSGAVVNYHPHRRVTVG